MIFCSGAVLDRPRGQGYIVTCVYSVPISWLLQLICLC